MLHVDAHERGWRQSSARLDVRIALPAGSDVTVAAGQLTFTAADPLGAVVVKVGDMTMDVGDATSIAIMSGRTTLRCGSVGDVSVQAGQATVDVQRTSGTVRVKGAAVDFDLHEVGSGDVVVETATGRADVGVLKGTMVALDLASRTGSGPVRHPARGRTGRAGRRAAAEAQERHRQHHGQPGRRTQRSGLERLHQVARKVAAVLDHDVVQALPLRGLPELVRQR